jgi:TniQ
MSLWPIHPQLQPDELLSSWMIRLAHGNGYKVHSFYARFFGRHRQIWNRDIDHHTPEWLSQGLAQWSGVTASRIDAATLRIFTPNVISHLNEAGATQWLMPLGIFHRTRRLHGLQFCPVCLQTDPIPYLRTWWRVAFITVCTKHQVLLQDACGRCGGIFIPHRTDVGIRSGVPLRALFHVCSHCGHSVEARIRPASANECAFQQVLMSAAVLGWIRSPAGEPIYAHLYFAGCRLIMTTLMNHAQQTKGGQPSYHFDTLRHADRHRYLLRLNEVLDAWPANFLQHCSTLPHPYSIFTRLSSRIPYWLDALLRAEVRLSRAPMTDIESEAIITHLKREHTAALSSRSWQLCRREIPLRLLEQERAVSHDTAELFLKMIDHFISEAAAHDRPRLIRDKIMLIAARVLHLSATQIAKMTVTDIDRSDAPFYFWDPIDSPARATAMLAWYANQLDHEQPTSCPTRKLFTSINRRATFKLSGVCARLQCLARKARLDHRIPSWRAWTARSLPLKKTD